MKRFLIGLLMVSIMVSAEPENEVGRYQLSTTNYGESWGIFETIIDTKTGTIVSRERKSSGDYE